MIRVAEYLGWPTPIIADSGNGWHLLYRIDLPGDDGGLVHRVLQVLAKRFNDESVTIDTKVGNASRICKLYGTIAAKGEPTFDRPHRVSTIVSIPDTLEVVSIELMESLVKAAECNESPTPNDTSVFERKSQPHSIIRASKYLKKMDPSISGDNGHDKLLRAASVLSVDFKLNDNDAFDLLTNEFNPRCQPPWEEADIRRKIDEAKKNHPNRPAKGSLSTNTTGHTSSNSRTKGQGQNISPKAVVTRLSTVQPQPLQWLWDNRISLGKLMLLGGDPGLGKSFVTIDMAARVSTGKAWPDSSTVPQPIGSVILFNCEDDISDTVQPRLVAAGGDPAKVVALEGIELTDPTTGRMVKRGFTLDEDLPRLVEVLVANPDARLVVIDPVSAYCGSTDSHKNADIRAMLAPLSDVASKYGVAVVMVTHLSKGSGGKAVYRAMGSLAFAAASRAVWMVVKDQKDDKRRLMLMVKMNLSEEADGLAYRIINGTVRWESQSVAMTADEHLANELQFGGKPCVNGKQAKAIKEAKEWLRGKLASCSLLAAEIKELAEDADISFSTLKRAKKELGVISERVGFGKESVVWWTLSSDDYGVPSDISDVGKIDLRSPIVDQIPNDPSV